MKKIIRTSVNRYGPIYRIKCNNCDTEYEYQPEDIILPGAGREPIVECPVCGYSDYHRDSVKSPNNIHITTEIL